MTEWYYIHSRKNGYLIEIDANGHSIWLKELFKGARVWMTNDANFARRIAHNRNAQYWRASEWLLQRVTPAYIAVRRP